MRAHNNVCVVGDDDQSIYGWRGAEAGHILEFDKHFPGAKIVKLEENYRSTPHILDAANAVIAHNKKRHDKRLWTARPPRDKLQVVVCEDAEGEAEFVAGEIEALCATRGFRPRDFAVLYRSNVQSRPLEEALRAQSLAYKMIGGQAFFERKEVKDAIAYLKLALSPRDEICAAPHHQLSGARHRPDDDRAHRRRGDGARDAALRRLPEGARDRGRRSGRSQSQRARRPSAISSSAGARSSRRRKTARTRAASKRRRARTSPPAGVQDDVQAAAPTPLAAQKKLQNLEGFLLSLERFEQREARDLGAFLHRISLDTKDDDEGKDEADQVTLVTLHGAKGLEFPVVFLVGIEEELLPHKRTLYPDGPDVLDANPDLGEERRLMYVGITRARELLYLTRARTRSQRSSARPRSPSRFLDEIPPHLYDARDALHAVDGGDARGRRGVRSRRAGEAA